MAIFCSSIFQFLELSFFPDNVNKTHCHSSVTEIDDDILGSPWLMTLDVLDDEN